MHPEYIIIHHSATKDSRTVSWNAIRNYHVHNCGWKDIGYHFGVEMVNSYPEIFVGRMMNEDGAHTKGMNNVSLGVCFVGDFDNFVPSPFLWNKGIRLVGSLVDSFDIPISKVKGHREYANYKSCPGKNFNMDKFREDLKEGRE